MTAIPKKHSSSIVERNLYIRDVVLNHNVNATACAIEFMKTVGADLHIRPKVESSLRSIRLRYKIMVCINLMDECINRASTLR